MEIDNIEKVHSIGYRLKDAKVTINQDLKFNVAGMKTEVHKVKSSIFLSGLEKFWQTIILQP